MITRSSWQADNVTFASSPLTTMHDVPPVGLLQGVPSAPRLTRPPEYPCAGCPASLIPAITHPSLLPPPPLPLASRHASRQGYEYVLTRPHVPPGTELAVDWSAGLDPARPPGFDATEWGVRPLIFYDLHQVGLAERGGSRAGVCVCLGVLATGYVVSNMHAHCSRPRVS